MRALTAEEIERISGGDGTTLSTIVVTGHRPQPYPITFIPNPLPFPPIPAPSPPARIRSHGLESALQFACKWGEREYDLQPRGYEARHHGICPWSRIHEYLNVSKFYK
jgi:hypothetical protein